MKKALVVYFSLAILALAWWLAPGTNAQSAVVSFSESTFVALESDSTATITIVRTGDITATDTVDSVVFMTSDGTATAGVQYVAINTNLTFDIGESEIEVEIPLTITEPLDINRTVKLKLVKPTGDIMLGSPSEAVLTIQSEQPPQFQFSTTDFRVLRNAGRAEVTVLRYGDTSDEASVAYATSDGTATNTVDYYGTSGTLFFQTGEWQKSFSFPLLNSGLFESNKTVVVTLSDAFGADLANDTATVTIVNYLPQTISWTNESEIVTAKLQKGGTMEVTDTGFGWHIQLNATTTNSTLSIKVKKTQPDSEGLIDIDGIDGDGDCKTIDARMANLVGDISLAGHLGKLRINDILYGGWIDAGGAPTQMTKIQAHDIPDGITLILGSRLATFQAIELPTSEIDVPSIGNMSIRGDKRNEIPGDLEAFINLTGEGVTTNNLALNSLVVAGVISETIINVETGNVGSVQAAGMTDSAIYVGFEPDDDTDPMAGGTFEPGLKLKSVNITGMTDAFVNSFIVGANVGSVRLGSVVFENGGLQFGVFADESIGSASVKSPSFKWQKNGASDQSLGDFHVK